MRIKLECSAAGVRGRWRCRPKKVWHKPCFKCEACGMTLNMKNYKGYDKLPYCNAHYPTTKPTAVADTPEARRIAENTKIQSNIQYHAEFEKAKGFKTSVAEDPELARIKQNTAIQSNVNYWGIKEQREAQETRRPHETVDDVKTRSRNPGKISDYDPAIDGHQFISPYEQRHSANVVYDSQQGGQVQGNRVQPGSIADYDPMHQEHRLSSGYGPAQPHQVPVQSYQPPPPEPQPPRAYPPPKQVIYRAMYDYTAADSDEVSFMDGDHITNVEVVDAGWMLGTVQRTGHHGMLPSNYVERIN
ncbi:LIM and sh3 domain protein [Elysia marginata]|uniref:LIM and sh3 domain protein n=1 Tax=Elysia marginata TaxID=1093978 RepID=A0AAV4IPD9_9GAST|nr:LIM and sh3 domain protein [Elysia marginata]